MINTFDIGKVVYARLSTITDIGTKVYPIIAENSTSFPFIVYSRDSINGDYCKDGLIQDTVNLTVKVITATYYQGLDIAQAVRENLTLADYTTTDMTINSKMISAYESFEENTYIQSLTFEIEINN